NDVGQECSIAYDPAVPQTHSPDREADQRPYEQCQENSGCTDIQTVAELVPEIFKVPIALRRDDPKTVERRLGGPDVIGEHVAAGFERHRYYVVDRDERPDRDYNAKPDCRRFSQVSAQSVMWLSTNRSRVYDIGIHNCTSVVRSFRIKIMISGIISGRADITAATPSSGRATSKALRMPRVAKTCVDSAGPPPETKKTVLKSPSVKIVESSVQTRYKLASKGKVT